MASKKNGMNPFQSIRTLPTLKTLSEVITFKDKSYIDESFMSEGRWSIEDELSYVLNLLRGLCITPLIVADAQSCLNYCRIVSDKSSQQYFSEVIKLGKEKVTCDSNNRQTTLRKLLKGEILIPKGNYKINNANGSYDLSLSENTSYNDLDSHDKNIIDNIPLLVITITEASRRNLADVFDAVNKGVTQNAQEIRQSWQSDIAQPIRVLSRKLHSAFLNTKLATQKEINRRNVDEFIVDCIHFIIHGTSQKFNKPNRDSYYVEESSGTSKVTAVEDILNKIWFPETDDGSPYKLTKRTMFVNFMLRHFLDENDMKIKKQKDFDKWLYALDFEMQNNKTNPPKLVLETGISYEYKSAGRFHVDFIEWNYNLWLEELNHYVETSGNIIELDKTRLATPSEKLELWNIQEGVCPETNEIIPYYEILNYKKWQADHIDLHSNGGKTTLDNLRLVSASWNLGRSKKATIDITL